MTVGIGLSSCGQTLTESVLPSCGVMTKAWSLDIGPASFYLPRIIVLVGLVRVAIRNELAGVRWVAIDRMLAAWLLVVTFLYIVFDGANATLVGRLGSAFDAAGSYILVRAFVRSVDEAVLVVKSLAITIIPFACLLLMESSTGYNPFAVFGGVAEFSEVRNNRIRAQGSFPHSILTGTFGATLLPLFVGLWIRDRRSRRVASLGCVAALAIVFTSASSGPLSALVVGVISLLCWSVRSHMRLIRWAIAISILCLAAIMKAPVWYLISKVSELTGGGTGWYRSELIDAAVRHFGEWWLVGTGYTAHWMATGLANYADSADIVNEFLVQGVRGGLLGMLLFIWLIVRCFAMVGSVVGNDKDNSFSVRFFAWALGCGLLAHMASFFSVSYFGQMINFWMLHIGLIAALSGMVPMKEPTAGVTRDRRSSLVRRDSGSC